MPIERAFSAAWPRQCDTPSMPGPHVLGHQTEHRPVLIDHVMRRHHRRRVPQPVKRCPARFSCRCNAAPACPPSAPSRPSWFGLGSSWIGKAGLSTPGVTNMRVSDGVTGAQVRWDLRDGSQPALPLDPVPGRVDPRHLVTGAGDEILRHAARRQRIGMVLPHQPFPGGAQFLAAGRAGNAEFQIGIVVVNLRRRTRRRAKGPIPGHLIQARGGGGPGAGIPARACSVAPSARAMVNSAFSTCSSTPRLSSNASANCAA